MKTKYKVTTKNPKETFALGFEIARHLQGGEMFFLSGPIGAGKTCFVKGIGKGLGIKKEITSPTFTLMQTYFTNNKKQCLVHADFYRLQKKREILELGLEEFFEGGKIICIEWAKKLGKIFPKISAIEVNFFYNKEETRNIIFTKMPLYLQKIIAKRKYYD